MSETRAFEAVIRDGSMGGALVEIPFDVEAAFGARRIPVMATFDGVSYRGSVVFMGGRAVLPVTKAVRAAMGKDVGDSVQITVARDRAPRTVQVPSELAAAFAGRADLKARFDVLSYTHRREYAEWVATAKRAETRERRAAKALVMLAEGRTR